MKKNKPRVLRGVILHQVPVGSIPAKLVRKYLKGLAKGLRKYIDNCKATGYDVIFMPTRVGENTVQVMKL